MSDPVKAKDVDIDTFLETLNYNIAELKRKQNGPLGFILHKTAHATHELYAEAGSPISIEVVAANIVNTLLMLRSYFDKDREKANWKLRMLFEACIANPHLICLAEPEPASMPSTPLGPMSYRDVHIKPNATSDEIAATIVATIQTLLDEEQNKKTN